MLLVNLEYFIIKNEMQNSISQNPVPQKSNFYRLWRLSKKLYKICTNDYDNNEYLAVKYIRFFTNDILWCFCNVMFIDEQKRIHENEATIPT